ncbi:MAG TPA: exopolysaccharide Pel transporter PelG [Acetobacteraceae bacterium]|jgi:uncharacterized membrane protein|nr:exopolysaccharide Pel transporter PelG [Acetobacteraceae bacterium]
MRRSGITIEWMARQRGLTGIILAYVYAALLVAGPWLFTILAVFGLSAAKCSSGCDQLPLFRSIVIYNSLYALVITSPLGFLAGRHISDQLYVNRTECVISVFVTCFVAFCLVTLLTMVPFYLLAASLSGPVRVAAIQNVLLLGVSWLLIPFLGAIRAPLTLLSGFAANALLMGVVGALLANPSVLVLLVVLNGAFAITNLILIATLVRTFGMHVVWDRSLLHFPPRNWELPLAGLAYALGIWVDKVIMWFTAPSGTLVVAGILRTMPSYDTAMFWAQLAAIPALAIALVHVDTQLAGLFGRFYGRFDQQASLRELAVAMSAIRRCVVASVVMLFVTLAIVTTMSIVLSFVFMSQIGLRPGYMSIFRISLWAMVFHTSAMLCFAFLLYFDLRRPALLVVAVYAILNGICTLLFVHVGEGYYGYGSLSAAVITFLVAFPVLLRELPWLHYHAFITNNASLQRSYKRHRLPVSVG